MQRLKAKRFSFGKREENYLDRFGEDIKLAFVALLSLTEGNVSCPIAKDKEQQNNKKVIQADVSCYVATTLTGETT